MKKAIVYVADANTTVLLEDQPFESSMSECFEQDSVINLTESTKDMMDTLKLLVEEKQQAIILEMLDKSNKTFLGYIDSNSKVKIASVEGFLEVA